MNLGCSSDTLNVYLPLAGGEEGHTRSLTFYICTFLIGSKCDFQFQKTAEHLTLPDELARWIGPADLWLRTSWSWPPKLGQP